MLMEIRMFSYVIVYTENTKLTFDKIFAYIESGVRSFYPISFHFILFHRISIHPIVIANH